MFDAPPPFFVLDFDVLRAVADRKPPKFRLSYLIVWLALIAVVAVAAAALALVSGPSIAIP